MKEDIIAANLNSIRQSIEELKKNNSSQFPQNVPNDDVLHKIDVLYDLCVKICKVYHQINEERKSLKVTIENIESELGCLNDKIPNNHPQLLKFPVMPNTPKGLISYILADIPVTVSNEFGIVSMLKN